MKEQVKYFRTELDDSEIYAMDYGTGLKVSEPIRHRYEVHVGKDKPGYWVGVIQFQKGPRLTHGSYRGFFLTHLLAICIDWLERAQKTVYACDENAKALGHLHLALGHLYMRRDDRAKRGVLGKNEQ